MKREPGYWKGYAWGLLTVPIIGGIVGLISGIAAVVVASRQSEPERDVIDV